MRNIKIGIVAAFIGLVVSISIMINSIKHGVADESEKYETYIGENCIIGSDTLMVVDYSIVLETFTLSNGATISYKLEEKLSNK